MKDLINQAAARYSDPFKTAFLKGITFDLEVENPYKGDKMQLLTNRFNWRKYFFDAFEAGRKLKIKHQLLIQTKLFLL